MGSQRNPELELVPTEALVDELEARSETLIVIRTRSEKNGTVSVWRRWSGSHLVLQGLLTEATFHVHESGMKGSCEMPEEEMEEGHGS